VHIIRKKKKRVANDESHAGPVSGTKDVVEISSDSSSNSDEDSEQQQSESESTPISSQGPAHSPTTAGAAEKNATTEDVVMADVEDDSDGESVKVSQVRRNVRAGFVVDDSDSE